LGCLHALCEAPEEQFLQTVEAADDQNHVFAHRGCSFCSPYSEERPESSFRDWEIYPCPEFKPLKTKAKENAFRKERLLAAAKFMRK
jgi:hypothetical protein